MAALLMIVLLCRAVTGPGRRIEQHLRAAKQRDGLAGRLAADLGIPHLGGAPSMNEARLAAHAAFAGGADEIRLQLAGREADGAVRQRREAAEPARGIRQRDDARAMQQSMRREVLCGDVEAAADAAAFGFDPLKAEHAGQGAGLRRVDAIDELIGVVVCADLAQAESIGHLSHALSWFHQ